MARLYVGNLDNRTTERDLEDEFKRFGRVRSIWVARKPPGFAFVDYEDPRDADDAVRKLDGAHGWRVEAARKERGSRVGGGGGGGGGGAGFGRPREPRGGGRELGCYNCGEIGHLARDCRAAPRESGDRYRGRDARSPRRSVSPADRRRADSPPSRRERSLSRDRSRSRSRSRS